MVYRPNVNERLCFVLLPLKPPFIGYFQKIITPAALAAGLTPLKADDIYGARAVMSDIWDQIWQARVVIAIVTGKNPNVNYELGICHTLGVPTVLITERDEDVPFDYRHLRYIAYHPRDAGWEQKLQEDLTKALKVVLSSPAIEEELTWPYNTFALGSGTKAGRLLDASEARDKVIKGAEMVDRWITPAFGPFGGRVSVLVPQFGVHRAFKRGANIAGGVKSPDALEDIGIQQMARLTQEVLQTTGDGKKLASFCQPLCCVTGKLR